MRTIQINEYITLTASEDVIREYEWEQEEREWMAEGVELLRKAYEAGDWDFYSDLHKDLYGFRPR